MKKKKLLLITGAGSSIDFGMPTVSSIDDLFEDWAKEIIPLKGDPNKSLYTWVKEKHKDYLLQNPRNRINIINNFENLLFTIQTLSSLSSDELLKVNNNRLNPFITVNDFPEIIGLFKQEKIADSNDFSFLHSYLVDKLLEYLRDKCKTLSFDKIKELESLSSFFRTLKEDFEIGFINLNYDNIILSSLPGLQTGFDISGRFERDILYNSEWNFCYHLHGSIYFDMKGGDDNKEMHKILWNYDLSSQFSQNSSGRNSNHTNEGINHLNSCIITGLDKTNQLLREPFCSYFMQLDKLIYESDAILFIGYGFGDLHLNSLFPFIRYDKNKKRKVVIIDYADDKTDCIKCRNDSWSFNVLKTLPTNRREMKDENSWGYNPVIHYKMNNILEKSSNPEYPLGIWYGGILEAFKHVDKINKELI
jgi:hypothetical protein